MKLMPGIKGGTSTLSGLISAAGAFLLWGLSPIVYKQLPGISPFEVLMHRMIWSFIFVLPLLLVCGRWAGFITAVTNKRSLVILLVTTLLVAYNWFVFIWAVGNGRILQTSLGYFMNPLVNVLLGMLFLHERLRRMQIAAIVLAAIGVVYLTVSIGVFPWISVSLALTFGCYGLIRKVIAVEALDGLAVETALLFAPAVIYLMVLHQQGTGAFLHIGRPTDLWLMATALVTAAPLLLFALGARRLPLTYVGFLQYLAPSCNFLLAVIAYHEPFSAAQGVTFGLIWTALALFSLDALLWLARTRRLRGGHRIIKPGVAVTAMKSKTAGD